MRTRTLIFLLAVSLDCWGQPSAQAELPSLAAMPPDARQSLRERLSNRLSERIAAVRVDEGLSTQVKAVHDREVLRRIEVDFDKLLGGRVPGAGPTVPVSELNRFRQTTSARAELYEVGASNIPEDKILEAAGVDKSRLLQEAKKLFPDIVLAARISSAFPKSARGPLYLLNPLTPRDDELNAPATLAASLADGLVFPSASVPTPTFDDLTGRSTALYPRQRFSVVGVLADVTVKPFRQICSGTLIKDRWFLTATHCLLEKSTGKRTPPERLAVLFPFQGGKVTVRRQDGMESRNLLSRPLAGPALWFGEASHQAFPSTEDEMVRQIDLGNDIALLALADPRPAGLNPAVLSFPVGGAVLPPLTLAGYGLTNAKAPMGELLLEVGLRKDVMVASDNRALLKTAGDSTPHANGRICAGDSGGPVFLGPIDETRGSSFQLVAIASSIVAEGATLDQCARGVQQFTRLDRQPVRKWLCQVASAAC